MNDLFRFPVQEAPYLKAALPYEMKSTLGEELYQVYHTDQMTGLFQNQMGIAEANVYTQEEKDRIWGYTDVGWGERYMAAPTQEEKLALLEERKVLKEKKKEVEAEIAAKYIDEGRMLDEEVLTSMYGDLLTIDRPMTPKEAEILYAGKTKEAIRNNILSRGEGGIGAGAAKFGVAFLSVALDPIELGIGFLSALAVPWSGGTLGTRFAIGAAEGLAGSLMTEPLYYAMSRSQQLDYTMNEALLNIGLGTLLGGTIGGLFGPRFSGMDYGGTVGNIRLRADGAPLPTSRETDAANIALRQFVNDEAVNLAPLLRDLRGSTSLTSVRGVEFQPEYARDLLPTGRQEPPATAIVLGPDGTPMRYDTVQKADAVAARFGGEVTRLPDDRYNVRRPIDGLFVRDPYGDALTFPTRRAADKFISSARKGLLPEGAIPVPLYREGFPPQFGVAGGIPTERVADIESGNASLDIPRGVNTREPTLVANPEQAISEAVKGVTFKQGARAYEDMGVEYATGQSPPTKTAIDIQHKADADLQEAEEQIEAFDQILGGDAPDVSEIDAQKNSRINGLKEAMACMVKAA